MYKKKPKYVVFIRLTIFILFCAFSLLFTCSSWAITENKVYLKWKISVGEIVKYQLSISALESMLILPDLYFQYPNVIVSLLVMQGLSEAQVSIKELVSEVYTERSGSKKALVAISIEDAFYGFEKRLLVEGLLQRDLVINTRGYDVRKNPTGIPNYDVVHNERVKKMGGLKPTNIIESILFELPDVAVKVGDSWSISGRCNLISVGSRYPMKSVVELKELLTVENGQTIAVLDYQHDVYSQAYSHLDEDKVINCQYRGVQYFNVTEGRWERIKGTLTYPDIPALADIPRKYHVSLERTKAPIPSELNDKRISELNEQLKGKFKFPFDFIPFRDDIFKQPMDWDKIHELQQERIKRDEKK